MLEPALEHLHRELRADSRTYWSHIQPNPAWNLALCLCSSVLELRSSQSLAEPWVHTPASSNISTPLAPAVGTTAQPCWCHLSPSISLGSQCLQMYPWAALQSLSSACQRLSPWPHCIPDPGAGRSLPEAVGAPPVPSSLQSHLGLLGCSKLLQLSQAIPRGLRHSWGHHPDSSATDLSSVHYFQTSEDRW